MFFTPNPTSVHSMPNRFAFASVVAFTLTIFGCEDTTKQSAQKAATHVEHLVQIATGDVEEIRRGLPEGAKVIADVLEGDADPALDPERTRQILETARAKVQDLRVAKSSFFAFAQTSGMVVRNDRDQDLMAGKNIIQAFPKLQQAVSGEYTETVGAMHEARGVEGKPDGQWIAAHPVKAAEGPRGLYITGWAWSIYAKRLQEALRTQILDHEKGGPEPLYYVFIVVGNQAFGTPASPEVNAEAISKLNPSDLVQGDSVVTKEMEITGRAFGLALKRVPALGETVMFAVLRSET